jgi:RNA polymerase sigma-70 factor
MMPEEFSDVVAPSSPQDEAFLQVLAHHTMLRAYILAIVRDVHLTEDALSEATLAIVHSWSRFDRRQPFAPWARGVARRVALANLRKAQRPEVELDEAVLESVAVQIDAMGGEAFLEERRQKLRFCVDKLPQPSRALVQSRYFDGKSYSEMARESGRTMVALYKAFSRIHEALANCVKKEVAPV